MVSSWYIYIEIYIQLYFILEGIIVEKTIKI